MSKKQEEKRNNLIVIKYDIEQEIDKQKLPIATLREILQAHADYLIMDKCYETISSEVANWFSKYAFIGVSNCGVGYRIYYRG